MLKEKGVLKETCEQTNLCHIFAHFRNKAIKYFYFYKQQFLKKRFTSISNCKDLQGCKCNIHGPIDKFKAGE